MGFNYQKFLLISLVAILATGFLLPGEASAQEGAGVAGETIGGVIGAGLGGPVGALIGSEIGGRAGEAVGLPTPESIWDSIVNGMVTVMAYVIYFIGWLGSILFSVGGFLIQLGLDLNADLINSRAVTTGWLIMRDLANMGLVIAIIVAAVGTMLQLENYGKKMLPKIIMIAVLLNFSLAMAGILIDASGVVSNFFISKATPTGSGQRQEFAENLAGAFQINKVFQIEDVENSIEQAKQGQGVGDNTIFQLLSVVLNLFFVTLFISLGATMMLTIAGLIVIRYVALSILLILMPGALALSIFPEFKEGWKKWKSYFSEWLFFLPSALFFLYLVILITGDLRNTEFNDLTKELTIRGQETFSKTGIIIENFVKLIGDMVVVLGLMTGGLIASKSVSNKGGQLVVGWGERMKDRIIGRAQGAALAPVGAARGLAVGGAGAIGRFTGRKIMNTGFVKGAAAGLTKTGVLGVRNVGSALNKRIEASKKLSGGEVKDFKDQNLSALNTPEEVLGFSQRMFRGRLAPVAKAAAAARLAEMGKLSSIIRKMNGERLGSGDTLLNDMIAGAIETGTGDNIFNSVPTADVARRLGKDFKKDVPKIPDITKLDVEYLKNRDVWLNIGTNQMRDIAEKGSAEMRKMIKETIRGEIERNFIDFSVGDAANKALAAQTTAEIQKLAKRLKITEQAIVRSQEDIKADLRSKGLSNERISQIISAAVMNKHAKGISFITR